MNAIAEDSSSSSAVAILEAVEEASGEDNLSISAASASYEDDDSGSSSGDDGDDEADDEAAAHASFMKFGVPGLGVIVAAIAAMFIHHFCCKADDAQKDMKTQEMVDKNLTTENASVGMT